MSDIFGEMLSNIHSNIYNILAFPLKHLLYLRNPKALNKAVSECDADRDGVGKHRQWHEPTELTSLQILELSRGLLSQTGASQGFPRAAAPVGVFSRGTTRISGSLSCGAREVRAS